MKVISEVHNHNEKELFDRVCEYLHEGENINIAPDMLFGLWKVFTLSLCNAQLAVESLNMICRKPFAELFVEFLRTLDLETVNRFLFERDNLGNSPTEQTLYDLAHEFLANNIDKLSEHPRCVMFVSNCKITVEE